MDGDGATRRRIGCRTESATHEVVTVALVPELSSLIRAHVIGKKPM